MSQSPVSQPPTRRTIIQERDFLTRFSYAHGLLCRWPGATIEQIRERVLEDLARMAKRVG